MMRDYLEDQIATRRRRLAALDGERAKLIGELAAYEDALTNASDRSIDFATLKKPTDGQKSLSVSSAWRAILRRLANFKHFNASEVMLVARSLHADGILKKEQTNDGVRAQLSLYTKKGLIKRLGGGNYHLTNQTRAALEVPSLTQNLTRATAGRDNYV
jgi:hypothetical protein